jgi:tetratricopeptide (TPR) repeat protein
MKYLTHTLNALVATVLAIALSSAQVGLAADTPKGGDWSAHWERGLQAAERKDYDTAVREFSRSIALTKDRESKDMYVSRGDAYVGLGKYEQAIADYVRALKLAQRNASEIMGKDYAALAAKSRELK